MLTVTVTVKDAIDEPIMQWWVEFHSDTQLTICLIGSVWVAVKWAGSAVGRPAGVGNADVNVELHIQVDILLF